MSNRSISKEAAETLKALRRAARRARELAERTGTPFYVMKDNRIVDLNASRSQARRKNSQKRRAA
jgi:diaminopimelate decarboxylase